MANTRLLVDAIVSLAEVAQKEDPVFEQASVGTVYLDGRLTVVDDNGKRWLVAPVTDEDIRTGHRVWIGVTNDGEHVALGIVK